MALSLFAVVFRLFLLRFVSFEDFALLSVTLFVPDCFPQYSAAVCLRGVFASRLGTVSGFVGKRNCLNARMQLGKEKSTKTTDDFSELRLGADKIN